MVVAIRYLLVISLISVSFLTHASGTEAEVKLLIDRADTQIWVGISNKGSIDAFEEGLAQLEQASALVDSSELSDDRRSILRLEIREVQEHLEMLVELHEDRFYGVFPLARLLVPNLLDEEGFSVTEQLFHPPDVAAIELAGRGFSKKIRGVVAPIVVFRSVPQDSKLENVAHLVQAREGKAIPVNRRGLLRILGTDGLAAFDTGDINVGMITQIMGSLDTENLIIATIKPRTGNGQDLVRYGMTGDLYVRGEAVQGALGGATPALRVATFSATGTVLDRREQFWAILLLQAALLVVAMFVAASTRWNSVTRLQTPYRMAIGAGLFMFGRVFAIAAIIALGRVAPDPRDMLAASWWWPALLGLVTILVGGVLVWLVQPRLNTIMSGAGGARGVRAVGTMFGLTALGSSCYFIAPELLLNQSEGYVNLALYICSSVALAVLFSFAIRTGPPVPLYFAVGPLFLAPLLGVSLLMGSSTGLGSIAALTVLLYMAASVRHRYAVAHGTEEQVMDQDEATRIDQERLMKLTRKLKR